MNTPLMKAVLENNLLKVREILDTDPHQINIQNVDGRTALHLATSYQMVEMLVSLVYIDVNITDNYDMTALHLAIEKNNLEIIKLLLKADSDINIVDSQGFTALEMAIVYSEKNGTKTVKLLIEATEDINLKDRGGYTPLHIAAMYINTGSNIKTMKLLLEAGADVSITTPCRNTILELVCQQTEDINVIQLLLQYGGKINDNYFGKKQNMHNIILEYTVTKKMEQLYTELLTRNIHIFHN